ncbi:GTP-binding protein [Oceanobacillus manasiensis]|uniref:GTP-binding protein n=1 Tax=Oceanobacillus manasiensis TaxID=586413 RepID=UPI0005AA60A4|nr:GTP-binding protein [Oceanobacillus manasiensis]
MNKKIPVTVLSGYLGAGKTSVLNHLLHNKQGYKIAVVVNDMSEINIDSAMVKQGGLIRSDEKLVELQNGCICCTLREDLIVELDQLSTLELDYVLIESTGISEPIPVAQTFTYEADELDIDLRQHYKLDSMVTVVNAAQFWEDYYSGENLLDRQQEAVPGDEREVADLLIDQIEFANVILINKIDLIPKEELQKLIATIAKFNPTARILPTEHGKVDPGSVLNTSLFDFEEASSSAGWIKELNEEHIPETEEYGIQSFVYRMNKPFHPERFFQWLEKWPQEVVRSKGFFWLASRNDAIGLLSQAGKSLSVQGAGNWVATFSKAEQDELLQEDLATKEAWHPQYGDRKTELVFIGMKLNQIDLIESLNQCVLTEKEMAEDWAMLPDPFPPFL